MTTPEPESTPTRRRTLDAGWAALLGAVIGGLVTGAASLFVSHNTARDQDRTTQTNFVRTQALVAYGQAQLAGNNLFLAAESYCKETVVAKQGAKLTAVDNANTAFNNAISTVAIIGSTQATRALQQAEFHVNVWVTNCNDGAMGTKDIARIHEDNYETDLQTFTKAARQDIGR